LAPPWPERPDAVPLRFPAVPSEKRQRQRENAAARQAAIRAAQQRRANRRRGIIFGAAAVAVIAVIALFVSQTTKSTKKNSTATTPSTTAPAAPTTTVAPLPCPKLDGSSPRTLKFPAPPPTCIDGAKKWTATFDTTEGKIVVALDTSQTAGTVNNFVYLALYHYYDGTQFDRIDNSIDIIQGGSPTTETIADPGPGYTIHDEPSGKFTTDSSGQLHGPFTSYNAGDLVMARGAERNSGAAQYFFVAGPKANQLAQGGGPYVTFGHATSGIDVLQKVEALFVPCASSDTTCLGGKPSHTVTVNSVTITES